MTVVREDAERFRLAVTDTGPGIAAADIARLFVEFEQLETGLAKRSSRAPGSASRWSSGSSRRRAAAWA